MENKPGAGAQILLSALIKSHSRNGEVIDENREIIELDRADRKDASNADINASSRIQRKGVLPERECITADYGDQ